MIGLTYSPKDVVENGGTIVFRSSNIQNGMIDYSDLVRVTKPIKERIITKEKDILICARNGSQRLIGKNTLLRESDAGNTFGAFMMVYRSDNNDIIHPLLSTKQYISQVAENLGARINQITTSDLNSFEFFLPQESEEKRKIGELFALINERIETQNKIIEDVKKLKSAIYETIFNSMKGKMFSLADVAEINKGKQLNGEFLTEIGDYYVMNGGAEPSGYYHAFNVSANTISISEGGNSCGYIQWNSVPFWSGGHCYTLNIKDKSVENKYLYHYLKWCEPEIMKLRIGSGLPNIQKKDLERVSIIIPTNSTQKEIIDLVDSIDRKIDTECSISLLLNRQKSYLLSTLFI